MKILFSFLLISSIAFGQDESNPSGFVANGVTYTMQYFDIANDIELTDLDTIQSEFHVVVSESKKFIEIQGLPELGPSFKFDSMTVTNLVENEHMSEMLELLHFSERREFEFELDYVTEIIGGAKRPLNAKWSYDDQWNSVKLFVTYTQGAKSWFYNFYFDEVSYLNWNHGLTYNLEYSISSYGETNTSGDEEITVFEATDEGTFVVNDTSMIITTEKINLKKNIVKSFDSPKDKMFILSGGLCTIPKHSDWIFYSFDYDQERKDFDGYYHFEIKEEE